MNIRYYQLPWPDREVPPGEPVLLFIEVDVAGDNVIRMVELFSSGVCTRNGLAIEAIHGPTMKSIVDGPFMQDLERHDHVEISAEMFEQAWQRGKDTPHWNVRT